MAHPFFERAKYPWNRKEAQTFHKVLYSAVKNPEQIDLMYLAAGEDLRPLAKNQSPDVIWKEALENLTKAGVLKTLVEKIETAVNLQSDEIQAIVRAIKEARPAASTPIITDEVLVLDREDLTKHLGRLEPDEGTVKVILVRGDPRSGKSHGRYRFFSTARDSEGEVKLVYLCSPLVITVDDVIFRLFSALNVSSEIPEKNTTDPAYYTKVILKLKEIASDQNTKMWIAIDDLGLGVDGAPLLDSEIRQFCDLFVVNTVDPEFGKWFRLMLIDYPKGPVPTWWLDHSWVEDKTSCDDIKIEHVTEVLQFWLAIKGQEVIEKDLSNLAQSIVDGAKPPAEVESNPERLKQIHNALLETFENLAET